MNAQAYMLKWHCARARRQWQQRSFMGNFFASGNNYTGECNVSYCWSFFPKQMRIRFIR